MDGGPQHPDLHSLGDTRRRGVDTAAKELVARQPDLILSHTTPTCAYRKSSPSILVMQSTQDRTAQNAPRCLGGT